MIVGGEQEADVLLIQAAASQRRAHIQADPQFIQQIRGAGLGGDAAVAVFGHLDAALGTDQRRQGRDVDGVQAIAPGADDVAEVVIRAREGLGGGNQGAGGAGDFAGGLPLDLQRRQQGREHDGIHLAAQQQLEQRLTGFAAEILTAIEFFQ